MGYVNNNLMPGEQVVYSAKIHWFIFVPGFVLLLIGILFLGGDTEGGSGPVYGTIAIFVALFLFLRAVIAKVSTDLAITSKRVIVKVGLVRRSTIELNHGKVESFNIDQSIAGRLFGFGTVTVNGTGGGRTPIPNIDSPLDFRRKAMETIDASQGKSA